MPEGDQFLCNAFHKGEPKRGDTNVKIFEVTAGSPILVQEDGKTYKYNLVSVNRENNTGTVIDTTTSAQESITVSVKNWVPKIVISIP